MVAALPRGAGRSLKFNTSRAWLFAVYSITMSSASDDWRVARSVVSYLLLFILISGLAGTVDHSEFRKQFGERRAISIGLSLIHI